MLYTGLHFNTHFSLYYYFFFANDLLLAVYLCILDYRNYVKQKANLSIFFNSSSKWIVRQQRQLTTSTKHVAQELLRTYSAAAVQGALERREAVMSLGEDHSGEPSEVHNDQLRAIVKADLLRTTGEAAEEFNADHSTVTGHF